MEIKITTERITYGKKEAVRIGIIRGKEVKEFWIRYENINGKIKCL